MLLIAKLRVRAEKPAAHLLPELQVHLRERVCMLKVSRNPVVRFRRHCLLHGADADQRPFIAERVALRHHTVVERLGVRGLQVVKPAPNAVSWLVVKDLAEHHVHKGGAICSFICC